jgi:Asp-tRNA(Asn)/Glu-tRNA(Gln) amidotransferase A subunit family amidase
VCWSLVSSDIFSFQFVEDYKEGMSMLKSRGVAGMRVRASELRHAPISSDEELHQRRLEDEATLETLRSFDPTAKTNVTEADRRPDVRWGGVRAAPLPPHLKRQYCAPTWITVVDEPRVIPGGPLTGFEVGIKDLMDIERCTVTAGTRAHPARRVHTDAAAVGALREAGAIVRGTTNLHALAYGATGRSSDWGMPENPEEPGFIPGGSSSGSAVAVAEGSAALTLGTDTSGSIRIPAALCGVVGFKPTRGVVRTTGCHPLSPLLDHIGPLSPSVSIAAVAMGVLAGWRSWQLPVTPLTPIRIGTLTGHFDEGIDIGVREAMAQARTRLEAAGVELKSVDLPLARHTPGAQLALLGADALVSNLETLRDRGQQLPADVRLRLEAGLALTQEQHDAAHRFASRWQNQVDAALEQFHVLICPTTAITATPPDLSVVQIDGQRVKVQFSLTRFTMPFNLSGHPAITIPFRDTTGTLIGVQLIGRIGGDQDLLAVAAHLERVLS